MEKEASLILFNNLTRKLEEFKPIKEGEVNLYTCGPTVYWYQHIGNLRSYIFADILKRVLLYNHYKVKQVINITDVGHLTSDADEGEDKMEKAALKEGKTAEEISKYYFDVFLKDTKKLNIIEPVIWCKATEHIKEQIELIKKLEKKGFAYKTEDGVYFDTSKFENYGALARLDVKGLEAGKRVTVKDKKNKTDFALWKFSEKKGVRQQEWDSPWGLGFPGWHIECSAMSMKYLGEHFDIHTGGIDHISVHHTNEIAQSEAATGKKFVNYWLHGEFLTFKGEKVSKSKGGLYTLSELQELGYDPMAFRYLCLQTKYNQQLDFSLEILDSAKNAYEKLRNKIIEIKKDMDRGGDKVDEIKKYEVTFLNSINHNLNIPAALSTFWIVVDSRDLTNESKLNLIYKFDEVLGLGLKDIKEEKVVVPAEIKKLADARVEARKNKDWKESDRLRDLIKEKGYFIDDAKEGYVIKKL